MKYAFFKSPGGNIADAAIRFWLRGDYSHVEAVLSDLGGDWYEVASAAKFVGVRITTRKMPRTEWDFVDVPCIDVAQVRAWFEKNKGAPYDYRGLWGFVFRRMPARRDRYFCSGAQAASIGIPEDWRFEPDTWWNVCFALAAHHA